MWVPLLGCLSVRRDGSFGEPAYARGTWYVTKAANPAHQPAVWGAKTTVVGMPRGYQPRVLAVDLDTSYDCRRA